MDLIFKDKEILDIITDDSFISSVRRSSILGSDGGLYKDEDIIKIALYDAYPRILMRISLTKDKDNNPIFKGIGQTRTIYNLQFIKSLEVIKTPPYSFGIKRIAISLTASSLIKSLPLNSELKFFDLGKSLEDNAISDLDKLIGILVEDESIIDVINSNYGKTVFSHNVPYRALFFSNVINLNTIPPEAFDAVEDEIALYEGVNLYKDLSIPEGQTGICYMNLSYTGVDKFIREAFLINRNYSLIDLCNLITEIINEFNVDINSNIIASLNINREQPLEVSYSKSELYPLSQENRDNRLLFTIYPNIHVIELASLNLSAIRNREVIHIDIRTINNSFLPEFINSSILFSLRPFTTEGIDGLVYGIIDNYYSLTREGPHSLIVEVDKGQFISNQDLGEIISPSNNKNNQYIIDTFYFRIPTDIILVDSILKVKVSTAPNILPFKEWEIIIPKGIDVETLTKLFHQSFYDREDITEVLGSIANYNAVQMVSFIKTREVIKIIIDIIEVPFGLEIATGNNITKVTPFREGNRSINISSILKDKEDLLDDEKSGYNKPKKLNLMSTKPTNISPQLKAVKNKLEELDKCNYPYGKCLPTSSIIRAGRFGWCSSEDD
ncbi:hypothetical protein V6O07_00735 [Arthrospira platensis SPKY2]